VSLELANANVTIKAQKVKAQKGQLELIENARVKVANKK
jgi:hypothetical protein